MDFDYALFRRVADNISDDRNVAARFYDKAVKTDKVNGSGLPLFKNVTYVEIRLKDNNTEVFDQPATTEKIKRFPREYALYKLAKEQAQDGTPLEQFAFMTAAEVATCKNRGVFTVEKLAELNAQQCLQLGLEREHELAELFLANAQDNKKVSDFMRKEEDYKAQIRALQQKIDNLQSQIKSRNKVNRKKKTADDGE